MMNNSNIRYRHSWYLSTDMQFFILSPFLLLTVWKWKRIGLALLVFLTIISFLVPTFITYFNDLLPTSISRDGYSKYQIDGYFRPWLRFGPYLIGMLTGYYIYQSRKGTGSRKLNRLTVWAGWLISTCFIVSVIFFPASFWDPNKSIERWSSVSYAGLHRNVWAISIGWIVVACTSGHGGFVDLILSWKLFLPLGRISYCLFLVSLPIQYVYHLRIRQPIVYDEYTMVNIFFAHLLMSILVATICTLTIEFPFMELEKILFARRLKDAKQGNEQNLPNLGNKVNNANDLAVLPK